MDAIETTELSDLNGEIERQNATTAHLAIVALAPAIVLYLGSQTVKDGDIETDDIGYGLLFYAVAAYCMSNEQQGALQLLLLAPGTNRFMSFARAATSATKRMSAEEKFKGLKSGVEHLNTASIQLRSKQSKRKLENWPLRVMTVCLLVAFIASVSSVYSKSSGSIVCESVPAMCACLLSGEHAVLSPSPFGTQLAMRFSTKTGCAFTFGDEALLTQCASQMQKRLRSMVTAGTRATITLTFSGWSDTDRSLEAEFLMSGPNSALPPGKVGSITTSGAPLLATSPRITETARNPIHATTSNEVILVKPQAVSETARRRVLLQDAPDGWTCPVYYYGTSDGCDCGYCGAWDPDCDDPSAYVYGCGGGVSCAQNSAGGYCDDPSAVNAVASAGSTPFSSENSSSPSPVAVEDDPVVDEGNGWTCSPHYYDAMDGCVRDILGKNRNLRFFRFQQ